jgi:Fic family protein
MGEKVDAFVPAPLPPDPPLEWAPPLHAGFDGALLALGRLDSISALLPDTSLLLAMYVRKEALLSSKIEGTQSSLSDLLLFELDQEHGALVDDVRVVSNYVAALQHGLARLRGGFPLSLRLLREVHEILLRSGRGAGQEPGEFRRSQNWIGGTRPGNAAFVPPPPGEMQECLNDLEMFLHDRPAPTPALLKAALTHAQFETIHPFLDGNGRLGRLLITLLLCDQKVLREPLLYLSLYFKTHRQRYYDLLNAVRFAGDWEAWLEFFADAVADTATQAMGAAQRILGLSIRNQAKIEGLGRGAASALSIHRALLESPYSTPKRMAEKTRLSHATVDKALAALEALGVVKEVTGQKRNRVFAYTEYLAIMEEGIEN